MSAAVHIQGKQITLRPATMEDRRMVYQWLAHSDISDMMFGPPDFPDMSAPSWEDFVNDYVPHYFDGSKPLEGRSFIIEFQGKPIGHINYNAIYHGPSTELDIWMSSNLHTGQGYGTDALNALCQHLRSNLNCISFFIAPSRRNSRAVRAYEKAGFSETTTIPEWFVADYADTILLCRTMK